MLVTIRRREKKKKKRKINNLNVLQLTEYFRSVSTNFFFFSVRHLNMILVHKQ